MQRARPALSSQCPPPPAQAPATVGRHLVTGTAFAPPGPPGLDQLRRATHTLPRPALRSQPHHRDTSCLPLPQRTPSEQAELAIKHLLDQLKRERGTTNANSRLRIVGDPKPTLSAPAVARRQAGPVTQSGDEAALLGPVSRRALRTSEPDCPAVFPHAAARHDGRDGNLHKPAVPVAGPDRVSDGKIHGPAASSGTAARRSLATSAAATSPEPVHGQVAGDSEEPRRPRSASRPGAAMPQQCSARCPLRRSPLIRRRREPKKRACVPRRARHHSRQRPSMLVSRRPCLFSSANAPSTSLTCPTAWRHSDISFFLELFPDGMPTKRSGHPPVNAYWNWGGDYRSAVDRCGATHLPLSRARPIRRRDQVETGRSVPHPAGRFEPAAEGCALGVRGQ